MQRKFDMNESIVIASYPTYREAEAAIEGLANEKFPVQFSSIIADGLQYIERVTGRSSLFRAIMRGLLTGATIGLMFGLIIGVFDMMRPVITVATIAMYGLIYGCIIGLIVEMVIYIFSGRSRDFESVAGVRAHYYDLVIHQQYAQQAAKILGLDYPSANVRRSPSKFNEPNDANTAVAFR